jgi:hypothetical protein
MSLFKTVSPTDRKRFPVQLSSTHFEAAVRSTKSPDLGLEIQATFPESVLHGSLLANAGLSIASMVELRLSPLLVPCFAIWSGLSDNRRQYVQGATFIRLGKTQSHAGVRLEITPCLLNLSYLPDTLAESTPTAI